MGRKKAPAGFYTAGEAIQHIGIPPSSFYNLVRAGTLKGVTLPGRKEAYYPMADINRYARAINAYITQFSEEKISFSLAINEDIPEIREVYASVFGGYGHAIPQEIFEAWLRKNPESIHVLRKGAEIVGYIAMFPLPLDTILKRLSGQVRNRTIPIDDVGTFEEQSEPIKLYIAEAVVKGRSPRYGALLLRETANFLIKLIEQGIVAYEVYALATTTFGNRVCKSLGMEPIEGLPSTGEGRIPYKLSVLKSDKSKLVERYEQMIARHAV